MSDTIKCDSCGGSNQLPEGKTSMFCAFCGNAIEKTIQQQKTSNIFPKIISSNKKEIEFEKTQWYKQTNEVHDNLSNIIDKYIERIEHYRTNDGYNVVLVFHEKEIGNDYYKETKETKFVPFEYDYSKYESKLNLSSMGVNSFEELLQSYELTDLEELTELNLDNNKITNFEGILNFKRLRTLSLKNNLIETFPEQILYDSQHPLKLLDLSNNKIKTISKTVPEIRACNIILKGNPISHGNIPKSIINYDYFNGKKNSYEYFLSTITKPSQWKERKDTYYEFKIDEDFSYFYTLALIADKKNKDSNTKPAGIDKELSESEKRILGISNGRNTSSKDISFNILENYSEKQIILATIHFLSPIIIALIIGDALDEGPSKQLSFISKLAVSSFIMFIIFAFFTVGGTKNIKTGRNFKNKFGVRYDEYHEVDVPGIPIGNLHAGIGLIHLAVSIIVLIYNFYQFSNS